MVKEAVRKSDALIEALPYIKAFSGNNVIIKLGGSAQSNPDILRGIFTDIDFMLSVGMRPVVVYGGGKRITEAMNNAGLKANFIYGQRVTTPQAMDIVARVMIDEIGTELLQLLEECGGSGVLLNGRDHNVLRAIKKILPNHQDADLGQVGEPVAMDSGMVHDILDKRQLPLIAPIACGCGNERHILYNVNGDNASALIARDMHASKLVFLSDIPGILIDPGNPDSIVSHMTEAECNNMIASGVISQGMIPKVQACFAALDGGVRKAHIISGAQPHALLLEIFTRKGVGTEIVL